MRHRLISLVADDYSAVVYVDEMEITTSQLIKRYGRGHVVRGVAAKLRLNSPDGWPFQDIIGEANTIVDECISGDHPEFLSEEAQKAIATRHHYYTR